MKNRLSDYLTTTREGYDWKYCSMGGMTRVNIISGQDIAHLDELDQKLWTVLSCPVKGLEFDETTLAMMDTDKDGKIRVNEIINTAKWLTSVLTDPDLLLRSQCELALNSIREDNESGRQLQTAVTRVLELAKSNCEIITFTDLVKCREELVRIREGEQARKNTILADIYCPYGNNTDRAVQVCEILKSKIADYFMRCKLISFDEDCSAALDVSVERVGGISMRDLSTCGDEIAAYPLARPNKSSMLPLLAGINPAWQDQFAELKALVFDLDFPGRDQVSEAEWLAVLEKLTAYSEAKHAQIDPAAEEFSQSLNADEEALALVDKFLHFYRDFYKLLRNYVNFADFYSRKEDTKSVFQAGKLYIDQRCCDLCVRVADMTQQLEMAGQSGMYLIFCHCVSKIQNMQMDIVAVLTSGEVKDLRVGKNAIFYDRQGRDWDATVTKIIDNPISIRQAFWAPYRKFWNWTTEKINKMAVEKENKGMSEMTTGADKMTAETAAKIQAGEKADTKKQAFDIAKFCGIFAAIGMAIGYIGGFLTSFVKGLTDMGWAMPLGIMGIMLIISGPSMFIAWSKLRKRNLGPVLNANGWAINAGIRVNVAFGATLTSIAKYPQLALDDPFADKKIPLWKKWLVIIVVVLIVAFILLYQFTDIFS